ncbi:MAG TPA: efflux RND transporter periplasmic adaptor subunit [Stellaceae bacterium]|nr:efflux RND transporter periplasmic adaptor subunit [Stellaceae bacterium]
MDAQESPQQARRPQAHRKLAWIGLIALISAIGVAGFGIANRQREQAEVTRWTAEEAIPMVSVITPQQGVSDVEIVLPGDVEAWYEAPIYARVSGYLKNWYVDYGAHVTKGQLLAEIDAPDLDAQLAAAQASLNSAKSLVKVREAEKTFANTTYLRWRDSPKGVVSIQEQESKKADYESAVANLNAAVANVETAQGNVDRLKALEEFKRIVAPFDGIVTARETDIGALINAGSGVGGGNGPELFRVADAHEMRIFVQVPQRMSAGIREGLIADLQLPQYPDKTFSAVVATTSGAINLTSRTLLVELHADNPNGYLLPGTYAEVHFKLPSDPNMVDIPTSALLFRQDGLKVALVGSDSKITLRPIALGRNLGTQVEVVKGLTRSDKVVNSPPDSLASDDLVRVAGEEAKLDPKPEGNSKQ